MLNWLQLAISLYHRRPYVLPTYLNSLLLIVFLPATAATTDFYSALSTTTVSMSRRNGDREREKKPPYFSIWNLTNRPVITGQVLFIICLCTIIYINSIKQFQTLSTTIKTNSQTPNPSSIWPQCSPVTWLSIFHMECGINPKSGFYGKRSVIEYSIHIQQVLTSWLNTVVRTSVYDWWTLPGLGHDVQLTGDILGGKPSTVCQPSWQIQPFILLGLINE